MPSGLTQELIDTLLRQQAEEFVTDFEAGNYLLATVLASTPEPELLRAGRRLIVSPDAAARILGTRLVRELTEFRAQAVTDLADLLRYEQDEDVICWIVSAFGFLPSESVTDDLIDLADDPDPAIRYHVATALVNRSAGDLPQTSFDTLLTLSADKDPEVRFSAVYELGAWWQASRDVRVEAVLRRAVRDDDPFVFRAARDALSETHPV